MNSNHSRQKKNHFYCKNLSKKKIFARANSSCVEISIKNAIFISKVKSNRISFLTRLKASRQKSWARPVSEMKSNPKGNENLYWDLFIKLKSVKDLRISETELKKKSFTQPFWIFFAYISKHFFLIIFKFWQAFQDDIRRCRCRC